MRLIEPSLMKRKYNYEFRISFLKSLLKNVLFMNIAFVLKTTDFVLFLLKIY